MPSPEFLAEADQLLGQILSSMTMPDKEIAKDATYFVADKPNRNQLRATGTPEGWQLLGMYEWQPTHKITIFEDSLRWLAGKMGSLRMAIRDTLEHEIYQHALGWDHVLETVEAGLIPAHAVSMAAFSSQDTCIPCKAQAR
ncbi:metallopeptidase family protein [Nocardioides sp.]|uniref:metallopeptidase family protein n=1 Tax=Nocardioides sp. TaxID=35761 RepID=UPI0034DE76EE